MKNHNYLKRLTFVILFVVFIPVILVFAFFWGRSTDELEKGNRIYYEKIVASFANDFGEKLEEMKHHAAKIIVDSKKSTSAFWEGSEKFKEHLYWYYDAVQEMKEEYFYYNTSKCGVYYYDTDFIITEDGTMTSERFLNYDLQADREVQEIRDFFDESHHKVGEWIFASTYTETQGAGHMLVGYCAQLGKNRDNVLIVYALKGDDYGASLSTVYGDSGINFYVLDSLGEKVCLMIGDGFGEEVSVIKQAIVKGGQSKNKTVYYEESKALPLTFAIYITEDSLQNNVIEFYHDMRVVLIFTALVLLALCFLALYVVYRPVYELAAELECEEEGKDEFGMIRSVLDERYSKIMEQELLIMDFLLKHLVHGVPISQKRLEKLGVSPDIKHYCVFVLQGHVLLASEIEQIVPVIEKQRGVRLFCTDWQGENKSILIVFLEEADITSVEAKLNDWLQYHAVEGCLLLSGNVVDKLDDIRVSFLSCLEKKKEQFSEEVSVKEEVKTLNVKEEQQLKMKEEILEWLELHYRDEDLNQIKVADEFRISSYTLSRMFKNHVGIGFIEYINAKRLEYAKELLLTTSLSIREISLKAGFTSERSFYRIFKATVGISPTAFREQ